MLEIREAYALLNLSLGSSAAFLLALLACACGGSSEGAGAGGAPTGGGPSSSGGSGSNAGAGDGGRSSSGSSGSSSSSGAGNDAAAGNSGGSTCPAAAPCGGDLVGDWTIDQICLNRTMLGFNQACPGQSVSISQLTATGTVSFKADGSMTSSGFISFHESAQLPASCVSELECTTFANSLSSSSTVTDSQCAYDAVTGC